MSTQDQDTIVLEDDKGVKTSKGKHVRKPLFIALYVVLVLGLIASVYLIKDRELSRFQNESDNKIAKLDADVAKLTKDLAAAKKASSGASSTSKLVDYPSDTLSETVQSAIASGNTAALESHMADSVNVTYAASEKSGPRTPVQAVADLNYLSGATAPWDFDLPVATVAAWQAGSYSTYIPADHVLIGRSANKYVVVFAFNSSDKISSIFVSINDELL